MLSRNHHFDIIVLDEIGRVDFSLMDTAFSNYKVFFQAGENAHGCVLVMIRNRIPITRMACTLPNVCIGLMQKYPPIFFLFYVSSFY